MAFQNPFAEIVKPELFCKPFMPHPSMFVRLHRLPDPNLSEMRLHGESNGLQISVTHCSQLRPMFYQ